MLDEDFQVEQVQEDSGGADEDVGEVGGVNLAEIAREEAILQADGEGILAIHTRTFCRANWHTLAMSSLFLSSPSTMMTFPSPSTSVQRRRGSRGALLVLRGKIDPESSNRLLSSSSSFSRSRSFLASDPKSHSCHVDFEGPSSRHGWSEDAYRGVPVEGD